MAAGALRVRKRVALLGATGSIGASTADVLLRHPQRFEAVALSAHRDVAGRFRGGFLRGGDRDAGRGGRGGEGLGFEELAAVDVHAGVSCALRSGEGHAE